MATDAFAQGRLAFEHNMPMSACEYPVGSTFRSDWMDGWTIARNARPYAEKSDERNRGRRGDPSARIIGEDEKEAFGPHGGP